MVAGWLLVREARGEDLRAQPPSPARGVLLAGVVAVLVPATTSTCVLVVPAGRVPAVALAGLGPVAKRSSTSWCCCCRNAASAAACCSSALDREPFCIRWW